MVWWFLAGYVSGGAMGMVWMGAILRGNPDKGDDDQEGRP